MPSMVMSQLPKCNHSEVFARRRPKSNRQSENILAINYMYVAIPKSKFIFYVRERLVYRSSVEVTYDEVFNYLTDVCNDSSISLHYTFNNQYVSITTTGQLHTFFQHLHNDPGMFLYIENKDYVWNVKPKNKKKKKCCAEEPKQEEEEEVSEEEELKPIKKPKCTCQHHLDESTDSEEDDSEEDDSSECTSEEEDEEEVEEDDPDQTVVSIPKCSSSPEGLLGEEIDSDEQVSTISSSEEWQSPSPASKKNTPENEAKVKEDLKKFVKDIITKYDFESPTEKTLQPYCEAISRKLINALWPPKITADTAVFEKSITILTFAVGTNLCMYFRDIYKHGEDPKELFERFIDSIIAETHATVETQRQLNHMLGQIHSLKSLKPFCESIKYNVEKMPKVEQIISTLQETIVTLDITFSKVFTIEQMDGCPCVESIKNFMDHLNGVLIAITEIVDVKDRNINIERNFITTIDKMTQIFIDNSCDKHSVWDDVIEEIDQFSPPNTPQNAHICSNHSPVKKCEKHKNIECLEKLKERQKSIMREIEEMSEMLPKTPEKMAATPRKTAQSTNSTPKKEYSATTQAKIDEMMKSTSNHNYVYPPPPKPGAIMIPAGGLAHCQCKKDCPFLLNEPAYIYMDRFNEPKQTLLEKTKQKRFKKN